MRKLNEYDPARQTPAAGSKKKSAPIGADFHNIFLNFNLHPLLALKSPLCQNKSCQLIKYDSVPDTNDSKIHNVAEQIREDRPNKCDAEHRRNRREFNVTSTAQTSHVDNLGNLEEHDHSQHSCNFYTHGDDMSFLKEHTIIPLACCQINKRQHNRDHIADSLADRTVHLRPIRPQLTKTSSAEGHRCNLHAITKGE